MHSREITRDELEKLYAFDALNRKELRYLLKISPNKIPNKLQELFNKQLNTFKLPLGRKVDLRGFIHSPPKKMIALFNSIHYQVLEDVGNYNLLILSSSPTDLTTAIPVIIPKDLAAKRDISQAHFVSITGSIREFSMFKPGLESANFVIADDAALLGFNELFTITDTVVEVKDLAGMLQDRFNFNDLLTKGIITWFMSSPIYEGRAGGNAFSPISPYEQKFKCDSRVLDDLQKDLLNIPLPYFTHKKKLTGTMDYVEKMKNNLKFHDSSELSYRFEKNLTVANDFLGNREPMKTFQEAELNISTSTLVLDSIKNRPLESFIQKPIISTKVLSRTDIPILFTNNDLLIDESETEVFEYSFDLSQLIFQNRLKYPHSPYEFLEIAGAVKNLMDNIKSSFPELHGLMEYGIVFDTNPIGGLGEHLSRISNGILRSEKHISSQDALSSSENLFEEMVTILVEEFNKPIIDLYYQLEDERAKRDQIKSYKLRDTVNSILFELNNTYKDGWARELFENDLKKRTGYGLAKIKEVFDKLIEQKEITERSPGLYWHILGFDRYL